MYFKLTRSHNSMAGFATNILWLLIKRTCWRNRAVEQLHITWRLKFTSFNVLLIFLEQPRPVTAVITEFTFYFQVINFSFNKAIWKVLYGRNIYNFVKTYHIIIMHFHNSTEWQMKRSLLVFALTFVTSYAESCMMSSDCLHVKVFSEPYQN